MKPIEIIILIAVIALVAFTVIYNVNKRKKGKIGCGCSGSECGSCPGCSMRNGAFGIGKDDGEENRPKNGFAEDRTGNNEKDAGNKIDAL